MLISLCLMLVYASTPFAQLDEPVPQPSAPPAVAPATVPPASPAAVPRPDPQPGSVPAAVTLASAPAATLAAVPAPVPPVAQDAPPSPSRSVVGSVLELRKELETMRRLIDTKAFDRKNQAWSVFAGGDLQTFWGGSASEALYVAGDGAVFLYRTSDPVAPTGSASLNGDTHEEADEWTDTLRTVEGKPRRTKDSGSKAYEAVKVDNLEKTIVGILAEYGTRITQLPDDESITVIVRGSLPEGAAESFGFSVGDGTDVEYFMEGLEGGGGGGGRTVLTIRVAKSQCQATADDRMTAAQLRERATIYQY